MEQEKRLRITFQTKRCSDVACETVISAVTQEGTLMWLQQTAEWHLPSKSMPG